MGDATDSSDGAGTGTLGVAGVGLIGGSIAAAARARGLFRRIVGFGRSRERLEAARDAGLIDDFATEYGPICGSLDLFVSCVPVDQVAASVRQATAHMREGTLATDAGSIKAAICRDVGPEPAPGVTFIGAHPLAGSERQGFEHASPDLFAGRRCVVTPAGNEHGAAVERIADYWRRLGSDVHFLSPDDHDAVLARTSHVPHVVAAALATLPAERDLLFAATGFRDATRIAAGDPALWAAILRENRQNVSESLARMIRRCEEYRTALESGDSASLERLLIEAKRRRDAFESLFLNDAP